MTAMDIDTARKFGQMESRLDALEQRSQRMEEKIDVLVERFASNAGGTKMLVTLLTLSAALGGLLTKIAEWIAR